MDAYDRPPKKHKADAKGAASFTPKASQLVNLLLSQTPAGKSISDYTNAEDHRSMAQTCTAIRDNWPLASEQQIEREFTQMLYNDELFLEIIHAGMHHSWRGDTDATLRFLEIIHEIQSEVASFLSNNGEKCITVEWKISTECSNVPRGLFPAVRMVTFRHMFRPNSVMGAACYVCDGGLQFRPLHSEHIQDLMFYYVANSVKHLPHLIYSTQNSDESLDVEYHTANDDYGCYTDFCQLGIDPEFRSY